MSKYEKLIEYIVNEQDEKARELFHQLVVERSRRIYESLIDEEDLEEIGGDQVEGLVDEITSDEEGMLEAEDEEDADTEMDMDDAEDEMDDAEMDMDDAEDEMDDAEMDMDMDDAEMDMDDEGGDEDLEDRIMDLEDSLDELKREFEELMGQGGDDMGDDDMDMDMEMGADDMDMDMGDEDDMAETLEVIPGQAQEPNQPKGPMESKMRKEEMLKDKAKKAKDKKKMTEAEWIREYVEKIGEPYPGNNSETSEVGAGGSATLNKKSIVAGKNDMGGSTQNIARGGSEADPKGTPSNKPSGLLKSGGDLIGKVQNSPGANAGKTGYKTSAGKEYSKANGKEGQTTAGSMSVDKKSLLGH
jgi:hypothetical protein